MKKFHFVGELEFMENNRVVFDDYGVKIMESHGNRSEDGQQLLIFVVQTDEAIADMIDDAIAWNDEHNHYDGFF